MKEIEFCPLRTYSEVRPAILKGNGDITVIGFMPCLKDKCPAFYEEHCKLYDFNNKSCQIRNVLEESVGEKNIVVPEMMPSIYTGKDIEKTGYIDEVARWKIDEVIMCLQQIKRRLE